MTHPTAANKRGKKKANKIQKCSHVQSDEDGTIHRYVLYTKALVAVVETIYLDYAWRLKIPQHMCMAHVLGL